MIKTHGRPKIKLYKCEEAEVVCSRCETINHIEFNKESKEDQIK